MSEGALRVLHIVPTLTGGGAEAFLRALLPSFDQTAVEAGVMTVYPTDVPMDPEVLRRIQVVKIERGGRYDPLFFGRMVAGIRDFRPDIVHAHLHNGKYWGRLAAMIARVPIILFTEHNPCGEIRGLPEIAVDLAVNKMTAGIVTFAQTQREHLARIEGLPAKKVVVIENGIALPPLPTPELRAKARSRLGARSDELAVLVVARLIKRKNQQLAIEAARLLQRDVRDRIRIYIIGSGEDEAMLHALARSKDVGDRVVFTGNRDDVADLLYGGDLFYMPSLAEGMPLAVLEAMSAGLHIVSTPWTGVEELLDHGTLGTILPDWEPQTTARLFERASTSLEPFHAVATHARDVVRERHNIERIARLHERLYADLADLRGLKRTRAGGAAAPC